MATSSSTKAFRNWMYSTSFEDIPPDVRRMALLAVYDGVGNNLACSMLPVAHRMADFVRVVGGPPDCTMIGFPTRTSALNAALLNGTLGHADEVDAIEGDGLGAHIMAAIMAAALTTGQLVDASGQEVLRGVVLGYELTKRVHRVAARSGRRGRRAAGPVDAGNTMGATAAAGLILGLPPDRMEVALSLGAHKACGITPFARETEHMVKSFVRGGVGAENGVAAALMAKVGYDAPRDIFDGRQGFFHSRLGIEDPGPEFVRGLGEEYAITGVVFKSQSAGGPNQAPRQALLELMSENNLTAEDIAEIRVEVEPGGFNTITSVHHPSIYGRDVLAVAAVYGGMGFRETHHETYLKSPEVLSLRERIKISAREDWTGHESHFHTVVTVRTRNGRELRREHTYRRMTEADLDAKFSHLVGLRAGEAKAKELARTLKGLDTVSNVADVMAQLELPAAHVPPA
jgi:2-methylcitrate dehydratase PrpD